ncbi:glycosyltransferase family 4 protein [Thalassobacillus devorans]|uniref:glycosyltransferase family 4 protein n=1 Tax=Thalassobacillus devorans TaxID=279813 RepID=UPI0004914B9F|nr:glycosyltransferase family 4 protein [Thalassobacillus devorans]
MKILITTIFDYPHEGGLSSHVSTLKEGLEERGHTVDVLSFSDLGSLKKKVLAQAPGYIVNRFKKGHGQLLNDLQRKKLLEEALKDKASNYDVINSQDIFATLASTATDVPVVATVHGYYAYEAISRGAIQQETNTSDKYRNLEKEAYQAADLNVTVDQRIRDYLKDTAGVEAEVMKNFINTKRFDRIDVNLDELKQSHDIPSDREMLFVPRRLTEKNGVIYPILALPEVLKQHPKTMLVYAGTGEQMPAMKKKIAELGLQENIRLLGSVAPEEMTSLYQAADIVLIPSVHSHGVEEATSISALEAMGSGTPVIAGAVGGLKEIIDHEKDGLLFGDRDVKKLGSHVIKLLQEAHYGEQLAIKAREKISTSYSHQAAAEKFESFYNTAINSKKKIT